MGKHLMPFTSLRESAECVRVSKGGGQKLAARGSWGRLAKVMCRLTSTVTRHKRWAGTDRA